MTIFIPTNEQTRIIDHPLSPLRVEAGAGTGKTTTVAHRIATLIGAHGIEPERVLGITFTNKAAEELADRVRSVLGPAIEPARQVEVHTYHGFASQVLREFGALVGVERDVGVVTPTFTRQMLSTVVRSVPLPNSNATWSGLVDRIRRLAATMGDHLVRPDDVRIPRDGDPTWLERRDLLKAIEVYEQEKRRLGVVDYSDLVAAAHQVVTEHPWVARRIQARFEVVVLDEYQDTNPAQRNLLAAIFTDGFPVTAVGDPDQTIYEWRGASLGNFRRFPEHFPDVRGQSAPTLPLTENRRSGAHILDVANAIRAEIDGRPRLALRPAATSAPGAVRAGWFDDAVVEAEWVAGEIAELHQAGQRWADIAILFRKNKDIALLRDALTARDIPIEVANLGGLLSIPEVVEIHAWLRLLDDPMDGPALARLLMGSRHRLGMGDLAVLTRWTEYTGAADATERLSLLEAIDHLDQVGDLRPEARASLEVFIRRYRTLLEASQGVSLVELSRRILDQIGAWRDVEAMSDARRLSARLNIYRFLDLTEQWSPLEGRPSLTSFLDYLRTMEEEPSEELDTARLAGADAVTLLTVHRAKGLEWPIVFVPAAYQGNFPSGVTGAYDNPFTKAESLPHEYRLDAEDLPMLTATMSEEQRKAALKQRHDSQEWRIAYVATTRAKSMLTVTGAHWYGYPEPTKRPAKRSPLYELVAAHPMTAVVADSTDAPERPETLGYRSDRISAPDPVFGEDGWQHGLRASIQMPDHPRKLAEGAAMGRAYDSAVEEFQQLLFRLPDPVMPVETQEMSTSVTGLVTYASCPKRYEWSEVDRLPRRYSRSARRGVEVHRRIELHHRGIVPLEEIVPTLYDIADHEGTSTASADAFDVFARSRFAESAPFLVEAPFELAIGDRLIVRGRVDAVYRDGELWEVVDFKSGRPSDDPAMRVQLQAYALALHHGAFSAAPPTALRVTFAYLGDGLTERTEHVDERWLAEAHSALLELADGICNTDFEPRASKSCRRCDFLAFCAAGRQFLDAR